MAAASTEAAEGVGEEGTGVLGTAVTGGGVRGDEAPRFRRDVTRHAEEVLKAEWGWKNVEKFVVNVPGMLADVQDAGMSDMVTEYMGRTMTAGGDEKVYKSRKAALRQIILDNFTKWWTGDAPGVDPTSSMTHHEWVTEQARRVASQPRDACEGRVAPSGGDVRRRGGRWELISGYSHVVVCVA